MFNVIFPKNTGQRYYNIHYVYVLNILKYLNCAVTYEYRPDFVVTINGKDFLFDFCDTSEVQKSVLPTFKFHCVKETDQVYAFPPVSFYDWNLYDSLCSVVFYSAGNSTCISSRQRPYGDATDRRTRVQKMLKDTFGSLVLTNLISEEDYLRDVSKIGLAVFVPGYRNQMIDRGHLKYLALGCCTISPNLPELLPFANVLIPDVHYVRCADDYSDVIDVISRCQSDLSFCNTIGQNSKKLFKDSCTPNRLATWIEQHL